MHPSTQRRSPLSNPQTLCSAPIAPECLEIGTGFTAFSFKQANSGDSFNHQATAFAWSWGKATVFTVLARRHCRSPYRMRRYRQAATALTGCQRTKERLLP